MPRLAARNIAPNDRPASEGTSSSTPPSPRQRPTTINSSDQDLTTDLARVLPKFNLKVPPPPPPPPPPDDQDATPRRAPRQLFDPDNLPPLEPTSSAASAFHAASSCILNFIERDEIDRILRDVYGSRRPSVLTLCELLAIAAVASNWEPSVSPQLRTAYIDTVRFFLDDCLREDDFRGMRVLALCGTFYITEKRMASWICICDALEIATRRKIPLDQRPDYVSEKEWRGWRRLWRSLIYLESWLAGSLGRLPVWSVGYHNLALSRAEETLGGLESIRINTLQLTLAKIGVLMGNILNDVYVSPVVNLHMVRSYMVKCEYLFDSLPDFVRLSRLIQSEVTPSERNDVFLIHMMYLGVMILLTRRVMVELARGNQIAKWKEDGEFDIATGFSHTCLTSARQVCRILGLQPKDTIFRKCWVVITCSFNSSLILLFHAAQLKHTGFDRSCYSESVEMASTCISILEHCAMEDNLAPAYIRLLKPFLAVLDEPQSSTPSPSPPSTCIPTSSSCVTTPSPTPTPYPTPPDSTLALQVLRVLSKPFGDSSTVNQLPHYRFAKDHGRYWKGGDVDASVQTSYPPPESEGVELRWAEPFVGGKRKRKRKKSDDDGGGGGGKGKKNGRDG